MIQSQFLYSYLDQFIKKQWVDWSEGALSISHGEEFFVKNGFQKATNSFDSTTRTRAREAYRLGLLKSPLISSKSDSNQKIPLGWREVLDGRKPHSKLGHYAYLIGKAISDPKIGNEKSLKTAIDNLSTIQILHIGFNFNGRWFCTVAFFNM